MYCKSLICMEMHPRNSSYLLDGILLGKGKLKLEVCQGLHDLQVEGVGDQASRESQRRGRSAGKRESSILLEAQRIYPDTGDLNLK